MPTFILTLNWTGIWQDRQKADRQRAHKLAQMLDKAAEEAKTLGRPARARPVAMVARPRE